MAYPVGVGTNYIDPRKSNYTKTQSLAYNNGINAVKDLAETTSNPAPQPTDLLGTNLRRGKGLTFVKGIAQFGGFIQGSGIKNAANFSMSAAAAKDNRPLSASYANGRLLSGFQQQARTLSAQRAANSKQGVSIADVEASRMSDRQAPHQDYGRDDVSSASKSGFRLRPHSAPASRSQQAAMPIWAQEPLFIPSWDKTVDNSKPRPGSAKYRPSSGLPLSHIPSWISLDKQVLSYEAYFKEAVEESPLERSRVRRCVIQYFLEDDTIKISEPREENSGMPQGSFLKRHKVPKGQGSGGIVTWRDIPVPGDLSLYGRTFRVTRCDEFTSQFYASQGVSVNSLAEDVPMDPLHKMIARSRPSSSKTQNSYCLLNSSVGRAAEIAAGKAGNSQAPADGSPIFYGRQINDLKGYMEAQLGRCQDRKELVSKYLANDRKVLRFYCTWDDKDPDGVVDKRPFVLHFFLADDTVEVLEVNSPNSGRDPFPALLKRMKLPVAYAGAAAGITGTGGGGAERYYTAQDLRVGGVVSVYGRQLMLNSCDESTSRYYLEAHGVHMAPAPAPPRPPRPQSAVIVPPHNGFGREEDARQNCLSLHPKPPRQNVIRLLENKGKMLRFVGKMESATGFDVERVFVVSYFLDTDEITIFEPPVKNSGRSGGKFAERCRVRKPGSAEYYAEADMHLGARLVVNCRVFVLVDADDFSMKYMEAHPEVFPLSDVEGIVRRVEARAAAVEEQLRHADPTGTGVVEAEDFKAAVMASVPGLHEQEIHTLARTLTPAGESRKVQYSQLLRRGGGGGGGAGGGVGGGGGGGGGENRPGSSGGGGWHGGSAMAQSKAASRRGEDFPGGGGGGGGGDAAEYALERLKELLYRRGPAGVRGLERAMKHISRGSGHLDRADLDTVLGFCGVSMSEEVVSALFRRFDAGDGVMRGGELVGALRPRLSSAGAAAVAQVFQSLEDPTFRTGAVEVEEVLDRFRPGRHPRVLSGEMSEAEARRELEEALEGLNAVVVGDLAGYYADVVAGYRLGDEELLELLRLTWGLGSRR